MQDGLHIFTENPKKIPVHLFTVETVAPAIVLICEDLIVAAGYGCYQTQVCAVGVHGLHMPLNVVGVQKRQRLAAGELFNLCYDRGGIIRYSIGFFRAGAALCAQADRTGQIDSAFGDCGVEVAIRKGTDVGALAVRKSDGRDQRVGDIGRLFAEVDAAFRYGNIRAVIADGGKRQILAVQVKGVHGDQIEHTAINSGILINAVLPQVGKLNRCGAVGNVIDLGVAARGTGKAVVLKDY